MTAPLLEVQELSVATGEGRRVLDGVGFAVAAGERVAVLGSSGAGKSMLALALMGLLRPPLAVCAGRVLLDGTELLALPPRQRHALRGTGLFMVAQSAGAWLDPLLRIGRQLDACARRAAHGSSVADALGAVGLPLGVAALHAHQLSGGMKQRVLVAMALLLQPRVLLADEPTSGLDDDTAAEVLGALAAAQQRLGSALLLITHDLRAAATRTDRILVFDGGRCVEDAALVRFAAAPVSPAGRALRDAAQVLEGSAR